MGGRISWVVETHEALEEIRRLATQGRVVLSGHARQRCAERGAQVRDVIHALQHGKQCSEGNKPERWKVTGPDLDGDDLDVVVVIDVDVVVVTVM